VELNPVRAGLVKNAEDWKWISAGSHITGKNDIPVKTGPLLREVAKTNTPILLVFLSVFCVATMHEYYNMHPLSLLEYEQKFYVIQVYYFL